MHIQFLSVRKRTADEHIGNTAALEQRAIPTRLPDPGLSARMLPSDSDHGRCRSDTVAWFSNGNTLGAVGASDLLSAECVEPSPVRLNLL